ncbi:MAG: hydroxymethylbilane synthase [Chloroflexi bacterium]|nr:MAG: hydroxymethylbilane synthase [Chloroflexota bacterium]
MRKLVLATRGSKLALAQSEMVAQMLRSAHPGLEVELQITQTKGDLVLDRALSKIGDKGLFVKEIEQALLDHTADLAVHSCKDLPSSLPAELILGAFPCRADPRDVLISRHGVQLHELPMGGRVGTSSLRRACQVRRLRPDLQIIDLRGNVDTRLRKAQTDDYDAIILAAAGLERLELSSAVTQVFDVDTLVPMVAQGALAVECRADDHAVRNLLAALNDRPTELAVRTERAFLRRLEGGCQVPIAAHATLSDHAIRLRGLIGLPDGAQVVRGERSGPVHDGETLGTALAEQLLAEGGAAILQRLSRVIPAVDAVASPAQGPA